MTSNTSLERACATLSLTEKLPSQGQFFGLSNCEIIKKQNLFYHIISVQMLKLLEACLKTWSRQTPYEIDAYEMNIHATI